MDIIWLLQGSFLLVAAGYRLAVDPYVSHFVEQRDGVTRLAPPPLAAAALRPDFIYCTHHHIDHLDPAGLPQILAGAPPGCRLAGPASVAATCATLGIAGAETVRIGVPFTAGPFTLTPVKAFHSDPAATGLLIGIEGRLIYLSGDTEWRDELPALILKAAGRAPDLVIICINGRWGNMDAVQAVETVRKLGARAAIPMHYGLFAENTADPAGFLKDCTAAGIRAIALEPGKSVDLNTLVPHQPPTVRQE